MLAGGAHGLATDQARRLRAAVADDLAGHGAASRVLDDLHGGRVRGRGRAARAGAEGAARRVPDDDPRADLLTLKTLFAVRGSSRGRGCTPGAADVVDAGGGCAAQRLAPARRLPRRVCPPRAVHAVLTRLVGGSPCRRRYRLRPRDAAPSTRRRAHRAGRRQLATVPDSSAAGLLYAGRPVRQRPRHRGGVVAVRRGPRLRRRVLAHRRRGTHRRADVLRARAPVLPADSR